MESTNKIFLYLGRRDKKGIRIIGTLMGAPVGATRVPDISVLHLTPDIAAIVSAAVDEDRMYWELWVEAADNYAELAQSLVKRGYSNIPIQGAVKRLDRRPLSTSPQPDVSVATHLLPQANSMLQRRSTSQ